MGENAKGEPITDPMRVLVDIFKYDFTTVEERLRLLLIFTLIKGNIYSFFIFFKTDLYNLTNICYCNVRINELTFFRLFSFGIINVLRNIKKLSLHSTFK